MRIIALSLLAFTACAADHPQMHVVDPLGGTLSVWTARALERTAGTLAFSCPAFVPDGATSLALAPRVVIDHQAVPTQISPDFQRTLVARYCEPAPLRGPAHGLAYVPAVVRVVLPNQPVDYQDMAFSVADGTGFIAPDYPEHNAVIIGDRAGKRH
ncbi:MAG TPA: hypothetical protein VGM88_26470 [Kofleriaceae bacterium]|jgi:hypothetical protein